jgi:hypothetical protein
MSDKTEMSGFNFLCEVIAVLLLLPFIAWGAFAVLAFIGLIAGAIYGVLS